MVMWTIYYFPIMKSAVCKHYDNYLHGKVLIGKGYYFNIFCYGLAAGIKENVQDYFATHLSGDYQQQLHRQSWEPALSSSKTLDAFSSQGEKIAQALLAAVLLFGNASVV